MDATTKDCKFCSKRGLLWLPLRYGAVGALTADALKPLPHLSGKLGRGVTDIALVQAKYAVRMLRPGFLYVLIERSGLKYWDSYVVLENAYLYKFDPFNLPQMAEPFTCDPNTCGINASMVGIPEAQDVPNVWSLFSTTALTPAKLDEYKANAQAYVAAGKMQTFSPADWLAGKTAQPHTLLAPELLTTLAEGILAAQAGNPFASPLGEAMGQQLFPATDETVGRLHSLQAFIKRIGHASFVLYDHIGITQELNDFRNAALCPVEAYLAATVGEATNQRRLEVMLSLDDVHAAIKGQMIQRDAQQIQDADDMHLPDFQANTARELRAMGRTAEADKVDAQIKAHQERKAKNRQRMLDGTMAEADWNRLYGSLLDQTEITNFRNELARISGQCGQVATARSGDHLGWLTAARLVDAFDVFDAADQASGFEFSREHVHCTHGMFGVEANHPTLTEWMNVDKVKRENLYMRANLFNQHDLVALAGDTFAAMRKDALAAGSVELIAPDKIAKNVKSFVDFVKKCDSAWDEWLRDGVVLEEQATTLAGASAGDRPVRKKREEAITSKPALDKYRKRMRDLSKFHRTCEGAYISRIGEWSRAAASKGGKLDKGIVAVVGTLMYGKLGRLTETIGMEQFLLKLSKEKVAAVTELTKRAVAEGRMTPAQGDEHLKNYVESGEAENAAHREGTAQAKAAAQAEAAKVNGSLEELLHDERTKLRGHVATALEDLDKGQRPTTNNFRQMRLGLVMMSLEALALTIKLERHEGELSTHAKWEIGASIASLVGMSCDIVYAGAKGIREIAQFGSKVTPNINAAADIFRGGLKLTAGTFSAVAGMIGVVFDAQATAAQLKNEDKDGWLLAIYFSRTVAGSLSAASGFIAAFSYTGPLFARMGFQAAAVRAESLMIVRTLWLIRVARFNLVGLVITALDILHACIKDDEMQVWCKKSTFRKDKSIGFFSKSPYNETGKEVHELHNAFAVLTQQNIDQQPASVSTRSPATAPSRAAGAAG